MTSPAAAAAPFFGIINPVTVVVMVYYSASSKGDPRHLTGSHLKCVCTTTAAAAVKNTLLSLIFNVDFRSFSTDQMVDCHALIHLTYAKT